MMTYEHDPDVVRWGLHHLDVCSVSNSSAPPVTTHYDNDLSKTEYVHEGFCEAVQNNVENDAMIAHALQEELKRVSDAEVSGFSHVEGQQQQASVLAQDWQGSSSSPCRSGSKGEDNQSHQEESDSNDVYPEETFLPEMVDEYILDGEVGKRLIQINPLPHVPRVNGKYPQLMKLRQTTKDCSTGFGFINIRIEELIHPSNEDHFILTKKSCSRIIMATSNKALGQFVISLRVTQRLAVYDLVELKISGDGNCQFRSLQIRYIVVLNIISLCGNKL